MSHALAALGLLLLAVGGYVAGVPVVRALVPVSPIVIGAVLVSLLMAVRPREAPIPRTAVVLAPVLLAATMCSGFIWASPTEYGREKVVQMLVLVPLSIWGGLVLLRHELARRAWLAGTVVLAAVIGLLAMLAPDAMAADTSRLSLDGSSTIAAGRAHAAAVVVLIAAAVGGGARRTTLLSLAAVFLGLSLASGSRGPVLAAAVSCGVLLLVVTTRHRVRWIAATALVAAVALWGAERAGLLSQRLASLSDNSADVRRHLYSSTMELAVDNPLGTGWGSLELAYHGMHLHGYTYPHNILLEAAAEAGLLGLLGLLVVLICAWRVQRQRAQGPVEVAMLGLLVFFAASAMVSGDLPSHRALWVTIGACMTPLITSRPVRAAAAADQEGRVETKPL